METIINKISEIVKDYFGATIKDIMGGRRHQEVSDARTAYIYALYSNKLMNGVEIGKHLKYTSRASYYHLRKYNDLKANKVFFAMLEQFEQEIGREVMVWRSGKLTT